MTKHRTLKAVGFFVVLAAVLAFLALPNSQAGAGKPIRWKATFDNSGNLRGFPQNGTAFVGGVDGVDITNGTGTCDSGINSYSFLQMRVYDPSYLNFSMDAVVDPTWSWGNYDSASCGFPNTEPGLAWPYCVADFLNGRGHPSPDYGWVLVRFTTFGGCADSNIHTLIGMDVGEIFPVHMSIEIWSHPFDCPPNSTWAKNPLHNLIMNAHGYGTLLPDIYIERLPDVSGNRVWIASVNTIFNNENYKTSPTSDMWGWGKSDGIFGQYAICPPSSGKGKKPVAAEYQYPWAKAPLKFQITFTKY